MKYFLFIIFFNISLFGQTKSFVLDGIVRDKDTKEILVGANVIIEGTTVGVATDIEGKFKLPIVSDTTIIKISFISYKSLVDTVIFNNHTTLKKEFEVSAEDLNIISDDVIWLSKDSAIRDIKNNHYYIYERFDDSLETVVNNLASEYGFSFKWFEKEPWRFVVNEYNDYVIKVLEKRNGISWFESFQIKLNQILHKN